MSLASNFARNIKVELIAKLTTSYEAYDGGTLIKNVAPHNVRDYFRKYGSTARKFDQNNDGDVYIGYVRISGKPEFLSAIVLAGHHAIAASFDSETDESNDFLTLMAKKEFADRINAAVERAASYMRQAIAPAPTSPPPVPSASPAAPKKDRAVWWMLGIGAAALIAAALLVQDYQNRINQPQPPMAGFALEDSYEQNGPQYSAAPPVSADIPQGYEQKGSVIEGVTFGMADAIATGVDELNATFLEGGIWGAESTSRACWDQAKFATSIFEVDKCVAFDLAAQYRDNIGHEAIGTPLSVHFSDSDTRIRQSYARFDESSLERIAVVEGQTAILLRDLSS